jgi:hypothetical protein
LAGRNRWIEEEAVERGEYQELSQWLEEQSALVQLPTGQVEEERWSEYIIRARVAG